MNWFFFISISLLAALSLMSHASGAEMQQIRGYEIERTEVTVGAFRKFVEVTGRRTRAEREGGGSVYEAGWVQRPGWTWRAPYGTPAADDEPAVHVTFREAQAYCLWAGMRLPTDAEWREAAYIERRASPPPPFVTDRTYPYPTGETPLGANCLAECGPAPVVDRSNLLSRGAGHARAGTTKPGVNGLYDMGANVWEWVDSAIGTEKRTNGGSWWYGAAQMHRDYQASKPPDTAVVYIGFRCARSLP